MSIYSRDNARRSLIDTVAYRALSQVATVLGYIVLVRGMQREDFGVLNLLYAFLPVVSTVASLGLDQVLRRYQPEYLRAGNLPAAFWLVRFIASTRFLTNVIILAILLLTWQWVAPTFKLGPYRAQFAMFSGVVLLHFQAQILQAALGGHMLHRAAVGATALLAYVKLIGYGIAAWLGALTLDAAILIETVGYAAAWGVMRVAYRRHSGVREVPAGFRPEPAERRRLVRYGLYNNFNDAGSLLLTSKSDNFFIAAFLDPLSVAVYSFYTRLNEMLGNLLPVRLFENVINPMFFSMTPADSVRQIPRYFTFLMNLNLLLQWPVLAFGMAYHHEIVTVVFGGKYAENSWLLPLVLAFGLMHVVATPATMVAQYHEKAHIILLSKFFAVVNFALLLVMVPLYGVYGAALATGSSTVAKNLFIWWHVRSTAIWNHALASIGASVSIWGGAVALALFVKSVWPVGPLWHLVAGVGFFALAGLLLLRSPALSADDRSILAAVLKGRESRVLTMLGIIRRS